MSRSVSLSNFPNLFLFNVPATTVIYTLSLHDALPIWAYPYRELERKDFDDLLTMLGDGIASQRGRFGAYLYRDRGRDIDRKSTRLNSSHANISYAVFCLKKKKKNKRELMLCRSILSCQ